jgi:MOSC domain-containing protein YiiM
MSSGQVLAIYLRPQRRAPVVSVPRVEAVAGHGLSGDHADGGRRQLTLLACERWREALAAAGGEADFGARRANVLVSGVEIGSLLGQVLRLGPSVTVEILGETTPCARMDKVLPGLRRAMRVDRRGGVFARILTGGPIAVGDLVGAAP